MTSMMMTKKTIRSKNRAARAALFLVGLALASAHAEIKSKMPEPKNASRPMAEMEGGCENFKMPLADQLANWDKKEIRIQGAQDDKSTTELPSNRKVSLSLYPQKKVMLSVKPEKEPAKGQTVYAGLAAMEVKSDGLYRIAMGSKVWLDLIEVEAGEENSTGKIVPASTFEMQTGCAKIFKAVEYNLKTGRKYLLQVSASPAQSVQVLTSFVK